MKAEVKSAWLAALRSGKYEQTPGVLRNDNGFCCLGVLLDVVKPDGWVVDDTYYYDAGDNEFTVEETVFRHEFGDNFEVDGDTLLLGRWADEQGMDSALMDQLVQLNDKGVPFPAIADVIEENVSVDA